MRIDHIAARLLAGAAFLAAVGCSSDIPTVSEHLSVVPTFGGFSSDPGAADFASASAGTAAGTIHAAGTMKLPSPCYDMNARLDHIGQQVVLYVVAERRTGACTAQVTQVSYDALITGANAGAHTVLIRHEIDETFSTTVVDVGSTNVVVN